MPGTVRFTVHLTIKDGKGAEFEKLAQEMTAASRKEPGTVGYDWHFSADGKECRLLEAYRDAEATLAHLNGPVVREMVPKLLGAARVGGFEIYGDPGPEAAKILGGFGAKIFTTKPGYTLS